MDFELNIPVTVVTGFLGSGKTTFINEVLKNNHEINFALVENEFGEVGIDTQLIKGVNASQLFELKQGCICCTISDEYELVLLELAERFPNINHLLIETTGIADPTAVVRPFFRDDNVKKKYRYNGTICLTDALNLSNQIEQEIIRKQLVLSDVVVLNKTDGLSVAEINNSHKKIQQINAWAQIITTNYGRIPGFQLNKIRQNFKPEVNDAKTKNKHWQIQTKTMYFKNPLPRAEFLRWLDYSLDVYKNKVYRVKGIVCFEDEMYETIIQGVGGGYELEEGNLIHREKTGKLVFIGKDLEKIHFVRTIN